MKALVAGGTGFAGKYLVKELVDNGYEVLATCMNSKEIEDGVETVQIDLTDEEEVEKLDLKSVDIIFCLAGLAAVGPSFNEPAKYLEVNSEIQINLFEACLKQNVKPKFLVISSGNVYCADELPLLETSKVLPVSPYAVSKIAQESLGQYYGTRGFDVITARPFNHIGPGQTEGFIAADLAKQIAEAEKKGNGKVLVGNLDAKRDYTDVRDIVRAYRLLMEKGRPGEVYNVCSCTPISGHEILKGLLANTKAKVEVADNPKLRRPTDKPEIYGSNKKITKDTSWKPKIPLSQTLRETLDYWRDRV